MTKRRNIQLKALMAKWLLITTLVVCLFATFGPAGQSVLQPQKVRTELVFSNSAKFVNRAIAYQIRAAYADIQYIYNNNLLHAHNLLAYDRLSKVKFNQLLRQAVCLKTDQRFLHLKIIPQNSEEDLGDCFVA